MVSPFPGMDPYLESPEIWRGFHHHLAEEITKQLNPRIVPKYYADVEVHAVVQEIGIAKKHHIYADTGILDRQAKPRTPQGAPVAVLEAPLKRVVEVPDIFRLRSVHIYETESQELVTAIEILSPANKVGEGLCDYHQKRARILRSDIHLVEIDLLRGGERPGREVNEPPLDTDYVLLVNRVDDGIRRVSEIWPVALNEVLPPIPVPLLPPDPDVTLDLATVVKTIYTTAYYELRIDYTQPAPPPQLRPAILAWLRAQAK